MDEHFLGVQDCIDYYFSQVKLLRTALTHSSFANEQEEPAQDNERLEFLGDAVLELCVSRAAYLRYPDATEGQLTRIRSRLVKEKSLAEASRKVHLDRFLLLGKGEEAQGGRERDSLLADVLEAIFGAVFLDGGYEPAQKLILRLFEDRWPELEQLRSSKDHKSHLQEITQQRFRTLPVYTLLSSKGPEHAKVFEVEVGISDGRTFRGLGGSLKKAEQAAANAAVKGLKADTE
ncbi:MAG: ribonuclease III [Desulfovibrionaceae bacterium]